MTPTDPYISVIVMASRHPDYVLEAVESVRRQTLDPSEFELVVVRDYESEPLERAVQALNGRSVPVDPGDIGPAIRAGVEASRGTVLTFLDDDDRYRPERLRALATLFRSSERIGFCRNNYAVIDAAGNELPNSEFRARQRRNSVRSGRIVLSGPGRVEQLRQLPDLGIDFNSSSMAVRKEVVTPFVRGMDLAGYRLLDGLVFFAALTSPLDLCIEPEVLTEYRIHPRNISLDVRTGVSPLAGRAGFSKLFLPSYARLAEAVRATGDRSATEEADGVLAVQRAYQALREPTTPREEFARLRRDLARQKRTYFVRSETRLRRALWLFTVAPGFGRWLYAREVERSERG
jgi:hypothetical protein